MGVALQSRWVFKYTLICICSYLYALLGVSQAALPEDDFVGNTYSLRFHLAEKNSLDPNYDAGTARAYLMGYCQAQRTIILRQICQHVGCDSRGQGYWNGSNRRRQGVEVTDDLENFVRRYPNLPTSGEPVHGIACVMQIDLNAHIGFYMSADRSARMTNRLALEEFQQDRLQQYGSSLVAIPIHYHTAPDAVGNREGSVYWVRLVQGYLQPRNSRAD